MIAFWLCPAATEREFFRALIQLLAVRFDAPVFEPHVTLQGGAIAPKAASDALRAVKASDPLQLEIEGMAWSEEYTKTLFVQFRPSAEASRLSAELAEAAGTSSGYEFNPHLSLVYQRIDQREKEEVAQSIDLPFEFVHFDVMQVISCPSTIHRREDVEAWRKLKQRKLTA